MADLIVTYPDGRVIRHELALDGKNDVGRDPACKIQIDDPTVSRHHADVVADHSGRFSVCDLGSKNGTYINSARITTQQLNPGDEIIFGSVVTRFKSGKAGDSTSVVTIADKPTTVSESISFAGRNHTLQLSEQRLQMLYDISDRLTTLRERQDLLDDIMKICIDTFDFERGAIALKAVDRRRVDWPVVHNLRAADGEIRISRTILKQALEDGQRAIFSDTDPGSVDPTMSIVQQGMRSAMCVPIAYTDEILGVVYGDRISTTRRYDQGDVDFFAAMARQVGIGLANARLMEDKEQAIFLEGEITVARQIQSRLFPESLAISSEFEIAALNDPGRQVSGDYYDVIAMSGGRVGMIIADVAGKGVASALLAANLQAAVRVLLPDTSDLSGLAHKLNNLVFSNTDTSRFITALVAIFDPAERTVNYISAGHQHPVMLTPGEATNLDGANNLPLGVMNDVEFTTASVPFPDKPTTFFVYTDGVHEAMNEAEDEYGTERLVEVMSALTDHSPEDLLATVRTKLSEFCGDVPQSDDVTMVAVQTGS
jgi:sigma-B regulation protein RsbU (phosphoserine phosphatase)